MLKNTVTGCLSTIFFIIISSHLMADSIPEKRLSLEPRLVPAGALLCSSSDKLDRFDSLVIHSHTCQNPENNHSIKYKNIAEVSSDQLKAIAQEYVIKGYAQPLKCFNVHYKQIKANASELFDAFDEFEDEIKRSKRSSDDKTFAVLFDIPLAAHNGSSSSRHAPTKTQISVFLVTWIAAYTAFDLTGFGSLCTIVFPALSAFGLAYFFPEQTQQQFNNVNANIQKCIIWAVERYHQNNPGANVQDSDSDTKGQ